MASRWMEKDKTKCWEQLYRVLSITKFYYKEVGQTYRVIDARSFGTGYKYFNKVSSTDTLLDDLLEGLNASYKGEITLHLSGPMDGPVADWYDFVFTKDGLVSGSGYYNDD